MTPKRIVLFNLFIPVLILFASVRVSSAQEIVLYASQAPVKVGNWSSVADSTAAGGARLSNPDLGAGKINNPTGNPSSYVELTFSAVAGIPYRIWVRGKAQSDSPYNDSIFVQFSGSLNNSGGPEYRIGTTSATEINLEDCRSCGISGWGWQDNGWGAAVLGPAIFFQSTGTQILRIQAREDGFSIDQIVLSSSTYLYDPPGALKNDGVILPASSGPAPAPTPAPTPTPTSSTESPNNTRIPPGTQIVDSNGDVWTRSSSGAILRNGAGTGGAGSQILYCNRIVYVLGTDSQWYRWGGGWTPVGFTDPCGGPATSLPSTESPNNTRVPPGTQIIDSNFDVWTLSHGAILRNGAGTSGAGSQILYCNRIVYALGTDSQWYRWGGGWAAVGFTDPCGASTSTPSGESASNTRVPPGTQIVDSTGAVWTLSNGAILRNGAGTSGAGSQILYCNRIVYALGTDSQWYRWGGGWAAVGFTDPCSGTTTPTPTPTPTPAPTPPPSTTGTLRVMSWNVAFGKGTDNVQNWDRTAATIAQIDPDLAGLCEMPSEWISTLVGLLSQRTGRTWYWHFLPKFSGVNEGNLILSKYPFSSTGGTFLSAQRSAAHATLTVAGKTINFFTTHLDADSSGWRYQQAGELMSYAANFSESRIVTGDFNAGPDLSETVRMTGSYYDSWAVAMNAGTAVAYPDNPIGIHTRTRRGRIDYVYHSHGSPNLFLRGTQIPDTRDWNNRNVMVYLGTPDDSAVRPSDHNPMVANFDLR